MALEVSDDVISSCSELLSSCHSLILATSDLEDCHASYAPFLFSQYRFFILVSGLAKHTQHLMASQHKIGCMLIDDETYTKQIFARRRLMFNSRPKHIKREHEDFVGTIEAFKSKFGNIIDLLDSLPDFILFELKAEELLFVRGFGDAHPIKDISQLTD